MPDPVTTKTVSKTTGRYTVKTTEIKNGKKIETTQFFAKNGTPLKADYFSAAEIVDAVNNSDYKDYYKAKAVAKDGKFYVAVTVKKSQKVGILAKDFIGKVDDGTLSQYNPEYFENYDPGYTDDGKPMSRSNKKMKSGDTLLIPAEKIQLDSPTGWLGRFITPVYVVTH